MEPELFKPFKLAFAIMKKTGMWHDGKRSLRYSIFGYFSVFFVVHVFWLQYLIYAFNTTNLEDFMEAAGYAASQTAQLFKFWNFYFKLPKILKSLKNLTYLLAFSADNRWNNREKIKSQIAFGMKIYKAFWFSAWTTCFIGCTMPFIKHRLPYNSWFPFNTETSEIGFWSASTYMAIILFPMSVTDITLDILPVIFMTFAIGLLEELSVRLEKIGDEKFLTAKQQNSEKELIKCIKIHKKILVFVKEIEENFSLAIFLQGLISSTILCASAYTLSTVRNFITLIKFLLFFSI